MVLALSVPAVGLAQNPTPSPYRLAIGMNPAHGLTGTLGLSAARDVYRNRALHLGLRVDATVLSGETRSASGSAITLDALGEIPFAGKTLYALGGAGASPGIRAAIVYGAGIDFKLRARPMFMELRAYKQPEFALLKIGVRL